MVTKTFFSWIIRTRGSLFYFCFSGNSYRGHIRKFEGKCILKYKYFDLYNHYYSKISPGVGTWFYCRFML